MTVAGVVGKRAVGSNFARAVRISDVADCAAVVVEHRVELRKGGVVTGEGFVGGNSVVTWQDERAGEGGKNCEWLIFGSSDVTVDEQSARLEKRRIRYVLSFSGVCSST